MDWLGTFKKGFSIYLENYRDVVRDIGKQQKSLSELGWTAPSSGEYRRVYEYLQRLVNLHRKIFPTAVSLFISLAALIISLISILVSLSS